jgi:sulfur relay (sulfurtransferase) DsrC/TusE family protein
MLNAVSTEDGATACQGSQQTTGCTVDHETDEETWKVIENLRDIYKDYPVECPSKPLYYGKFDVYKD